MLGSSKEVDEFSLDKYGRRPSIKPSKQHRTRPVYSPRIAPYKSASNSRNALGPDIAGSSLQGVDEVFAQIAMWIDKEKKKLQVRETTEKPRMNEFQDARDVPISADEKPKPKSRRRSSASSNGSMALDQLEEILKHGMALTVSGNAFPRQRSQRSQRHTFSRKLVRQSTTIGSDTEYFSDGDTVVPHCDAVLDNTQTLNGTVDSTSSGHRPCSPNDAQEKVPTAWKTFKYEILRLAHTLRLKGWRRVPLEMSQELAVERLCGALTNAVYVVSPPSQIPDSDVDRSRTESWRRFRKPPMYVPLSQFRKHELISSSRKLLLRIYGPRADHLIDRENELQILCRLSKKHIGPRLLGTFQNGRFEEYFYASTLKPEDMHEPDTFSQIAKRMRELHMGVDLLDAERQAGPFVWQNWDKWVGRCENIISYVDRKLLTTKNVHMSKRFKRLGLFSTLEWNLFRRTVERYRRWLVEQYGGSEALRDRLVFTHNDVRIFLPQVTVLSNNIQTQYGNILRLEPSTDSPLLLPANKHKQLIVIDFEYANANTVGYEFATHFVRRPFCISWIASCC